MIQTILKRLGTLRDGPLKRRRLLTFLAPLTLLGLGPTNLTIGAFGSNLKSFSGTARHSAMLGLGILRVSGETNVALTADTTYDIATIGAHIPTSTYALSVYCQKDLDARLGSAGTIQIRPKEDIPAGYDIYIAGIWIAS